MIKKRKWELKSKNYFARIKIKKNEKDGEYYDIVFGLKRQGREMRAHYGIRVEVENGTIGGKVFFVDPRKAISHHREETINPKTGKVISKLDKPFKGVSGKTGAEFHYSTFYDKKKKMLFLKEFKIIEFDKPQ